MKTLPLSRPALSGISVALAVLLSLNPAQGAEQTWQAGPPKAGTLAMGWTAKVRYRNGEVRLRLRDSRNQPIEQAQVNVTLRHSVRSDLSVSLRLKEVRRGVYAAPADLPEKGFWTVIISARRLDRDYDSTATIEVE